MKKIILFFIIFVIPLIGQDITNKLGGDDNTVSYEVRNVGGTLLFRIQGDGGALFVNNAIPGTIPIEGIGDRMMWYPAKSAFRAGFVDGTQWNDINVGSYSAAFGDGTIASGAKSIAAGNATTASEYASTAIGSSTTASGSKSLAMGSSTTASGENSIAIGENTSASGETSIATGYQTNASGDFSTAMGYSTTASEHSSTAMGSSTTASGSKSTALGSATTASGTSSTAMGSGTTASGDYTTAIGRNIQASGESSVAIALNNQGGANVTQANTMAIMGGNVGIGTVAPDANIDVHGTVKMFGAYEAKLFDTEYQADTDGFVLSQASGGVNLEGYVDVSTPATTTVAQASSDKASILIPVPKGYYWQVANLSLSPGTVFWIPLGQ